MFKRTLCFIAMLLLPFGAGNAIAQVFWTESFPSPVTAWSINVSLGGEAANANFFKIGQGEGGGIPPDLGNPASCGIADNGNNTLHITSTFSPNSGARYNAGGLCPLMCVTTNKRAESPTIDCSGKSSITLSFSYLEFGAGSNDDASLWYYDGTVWALLVNTPKTNCCGGVCNNSRQGMWASYSVVLPASANNNPNVKIGFSWKNNDDGTGTDPSFAVDDITLSSASANTITTETISPVSYCAGEAISIPFTSTGTFNAGNVYTAQLSNASGSFASPVNLGTLTSTANSGTISGTIPSGTSGGSAYQIRVVSSNPAVTGTSFGPVTIKQLPDVTTGSGAYSICSGSSANISISSSMGGTTFSWSGSDGSSGTGSPIDIPLNNNLCSPMVVTYTITPANNGCTGASITRDVTVNAYPTSYFSITPNPACSEQSAIATFTGKYCAGATFNWTFPGGTNIISGAGMGPYELQWTTPGEKITRLQVVNPGGACTSFTTRDTILVIDPPTLNPTDVCEGTKPAFTAGDGNFYEFFINGVSQGAMGTGTTFTPAANLAAADQVCVRSYNKPQFIFDGKIVEKEWGTALARSTRGPTSSGFGLNNIDAIYLNNGYGNLNMGIAGRLVNENAPNKILVFIDSKSGGHNSLSTWLSRVNSPYKSIENLNSSISFDVGFAPDYILAINGNLGDWFFDLYDMQADANNFLGSVNTAPARFAYTANSGTGDYYQGFEFNFPLADIGNPTGSIQVFAMLVNDPGLLGAPTFLSNQFLSCANILENNYGDGSGAPIVFANAAPNPIPYKIGPDCYKETCITVQANTTLNLTELGPFCEGELLPPGPLLPGDIYGITGTWSPSASPDVNSPGVQTFTFTPDPGQCATPNPYTTNITIKALPTTTTIFHD